MTTSPRARWTRAVALLALAAGTLAVSAAPVAAAPKPISILSVSAENVEPGDTVRVRFRVTNTGSAAETAIVVVGGGLPCRTGCRAEPSLGPGRSKDFTATVVAPPAAPGETTGLNISVAVRLAGQNNFDFKMVYVHGAGASTPGTGTPAAQVDRVTGRVRDADGENVGGVAVTVKDGAGHEYRTTSGPNGRFAIRSTDAAPISAGTIGVVATKKGYRTARATVQGTAGDTATVPVTLTALAELTTKASPSVSATPFVADPDTPAPKASVDALAAPDFDAVSDEGSGPLPFALGGLLVVVGLGVLALVVVRRRNTRPVPAQLAATQLLPIQDRGRSR
ncbi:carboxypeptidase-like regulatory domain-containing protein [Actinoplanes sichuanensis]|uniref:alpha-amylase n=1 Tax=Actinoplanes sichuanensis TaxID=512349 RepID=A0ABW4AJJ0_9ACTN|nr:carboxypeptidase-like regulatory domain-containing protein [Actinoplanes sichuanensis]